jgi:hypothetical protein
MLLKIQIPASWNELPVKTLQKVALYFHTNTTGKKLDILIFFALLNIKWYQIKKIITAYRTLKQVPLSELKTHFNFIYKDHNLTKFIPYLCINRKFSFLLLRPLVVYAPGDRLHNISIKEFAVCEDLMFYFHQTQNIQYLRYMAAVLYREKINGKKIPFNKDHLDENVKKFQHISPVKLYTIYMAYKGSSLLIQNTYSKRIFKKLPPNTSKNQKKPQPPNFEELILAMAGKKFGNLQQTEKTNIHSFLKEYNNLLKNK